MIRKPHLSIVPLLDEEQSKIFFHLAMEAWQIIEGDKRGQNQTDEEADDNEINTIIQVA